MVYYRKYRPQTIGELDSSKVRETLYAVFSRPEIPHAFLLTGPKGLGKTSTARIIAKVINCEHAGEGKASSVKGKEKENTLNASPLALHASIEPDNICDQCISITNGSNIDVLEIDGASNRGIDEIRDLRDKVKLAPSRAKKKVYIIDEVHMLTTEAFNALLKTIEEPPAHVMFIFCTTEPHKVPETILSRCFHVGYTRATEEDLVRSFKRIVTGEKITITDEALQFVAKLSDGGFRDGAKLLEELVTLSAGKEITKDFIDQKYQISGISYFVSGILQVLEKKNVKEGIAILIKLEEQGIDAKYFISQVLEALHSLLLESIGVEKNTKYQIANTKYSILEIEQLVSLFSDAYQQIKYAVIPSLPLELAVVVWCNAYTESTEKNSVSSVDNSVSSVNTKNTMNTLLKKEKNMKVQEILKGPKGSKEPDEPKVGGGSQEELTDKNTAEQLMENLIYKVKAVNFSIAGVLRGCTLKDLTSEKIIFQTTYKFHKEKLDDAKTKNILEQAIREITGKEIKVVVELKS